MDKYSANIYFSGTKQIRKLTETVSVSSFFNFFQKHEIPAEEELDNMHEEPWFVAYMKLLCTQHDQILIRLFSGLEHIHDQQIYLVVAC